MSRAHSSCSTRSNSCSTSWVALTHNQRSTQCPHWRPSGSAEHGHDSSMHSTRLCPSGARNDFQGIVEGVDWWLACRAGWRHVLACQLRGPDSQPRRKSFASRLPNCNHWRIDLETAPLFSFETSLPRLCLGGKWHVPTRNQSGRSCGLERP